MYLVSTQNHLSSQQTENKNTDESDSDPPTREVPVCILTTYTRFASGFDSLSLILRQSTFQCPNSLQKAYWFFFRSLKSALDFDLPRSLLPFRLELLPLVVNASADVLLEDSLSFLLISWFTRAGKLHYSQWIVYRWLRWKWKTHSPHQKENSKESTHCPPPYHHILLAKSVRSFV